MIGFVVGAWSGVFVLSMFSFISNAPFPWYSLVFAVIATVAWLVTRKRG